jgi:hypothetical protein
MAFCNSCGAALSADSKFCNQCGAAFSGTAAPAATPASPPPTTKSGSSAIKIILAVVGVIVCLGIIGIATVTFVAYRFAKNSHVTHDGDHVKVETPFGSVETSKDPQQVAQELGVDIYPGAQISQNGAQSASFGSVRTVSANFESSDPADKVCDFYRSKFPGATVTSSDANHCTIVSNDKQNVVTINVEAHIFKEPNQGDYTAIQISSVTKKSSSGN